ncbi:MAG: ParB/RepB/Spo0J family partition protein [Gammaproteobacteria bacterium]|jgi:ParB family chromosome partitioning protein
MVADDNRRRGLGRGLSALFGEEDDGPQSIAAGDGDGIRMLPVDALTPGPYQPRQTFDDDALEGLAASIREKGVLEPVLVRPTPGREDSFQIIAGERRWRAAQRAQQHEIPVIIRGFSDIDAMEIALIENLHREDLSALEEAEAYRRLIDEFGHTQDRLAQAISKSRSHVANTLRLLALPDPVKARIREGELSAGHARALLTAEDPESLAAEVVSKGLNVRQTERLAQRGKPGSTGRPRGRPPKPAKDPNTAALERDLAAMLGLTVSIEERGEGGTLSIHYETLEQLDDLLQRLSDSKN